LNPEWENPDIFLVSRAYTVFIEAVTSFLTPSTPHFLFFILFQKQMTVFPFMPFLLTFNKI
jgi:hypothetical protein